MKNITNNFVTIIAIKIKLKLKINGEKKITNFKAKIKNFFFSLMTQNINKGKNA